MGAGRDLAQLVLCLFALYCLSLDLQSWARKHLPVILAPGRYGWEDQEFRSNLGRRMQPLGESNEQLEGLRKDLKGKCSLCSWRLGLPPAYIPTRVHCAEVKMMPIRAGVLCKCLHQASHAYHGVPLLYGLPMPSVIHGPPLRPCLLAKGSHRARGLSALLTRRG